MNLELTRKIYTTRSTIGEITYNGSSKCFILEDPVRPKKIKGITAIPAGTYRVVITHSQKFGRTMPLLLDVPGYEGIRIHPGNNPDHTEGCLLPGQTKGLDSVGSSRAAYDDLFAEIKKALDGGDTVDIRITEGGVSPFMNGELPSPGTKGTIMRVKGDPLNLRAAPSSTSKTPIISELPYGTTVTLSGTPPTGDWLHVSVSNNGTEQQGWVYGKYLEVLAPGSLPPASPSGKPAAPAAKKSPTPAPPLDEDSIYRVTGTDSLNLRSEPAVLTAQTLVAALPAGHRVTKIAKSNKPGWIEVATILNGSTVRGFVHGAFLARENQLSNSASGDLQVTDRALQMILDFEGMDQPSRWPGVMSGISLGHGYDIGYHTRDEFESDWGNHLSPDQIKRLAKAIGKRGQAASALASQYTDIKITVPMADAVFARSTLPKIKATTLKTFPGVLKLPGDAQGALASLVYNRGGSMEGSRRREMLEIRNLCANGAMGIPDKIDGIADAIVSMKRLWPDTLGLRRRRDAEAKLVRESV